MGKPVVPDVYWICAGSDGLGARSGAVILAGKQRVVIRQQDAVADGRNFVARRVRDFLHRVAAEIGHVIERLGPRLLEHIFELALLVGRVDRHQRYAGKAAGQLPADTHSGMLFA